MDLPLLPVLVGTLPVAALIVPTVLAGSFTYMSSINLPDNITPEFPWAGTAATVCTALAALVLFSCVLAAAYYVEQAVSTRKDELEEMPFDEEVKKANDAEVAFNDAYDKVIVWKDMPTAIQILLLVSLASMITCCYMVQLFQEDAFEEYTLTDRINTHLGGDWKNLVKPIGFIAIILFLSSLFLLFLFSSWATNRANSRLKKETEEPQDGIPETENVELAEGSENREQ